MTRPHWINCYYRGDVPDVIHYDDSPHYEEWQARKEALQSDGTGSYGVTYYYSHTLYVHAGAHGKPVVEFIEFTLPPEPALEPRRVCSWE